MPTAKSLCTNSSISEFDVYYDKRLGKGGFGEVFLARRIGTDCEVALKMLNKKAIREKGMEKRVWDEVRIHSQLRHPRIVEMNECFQDEKCIYIVLELCPNGDLRRYLKTARNSGFNEDHAARFLDQIIDGVLYLHKKRIIHRDLSASNILLDKDMNIKIGDFGLATQMNSVDEKHFTMCGTPNFMAPEVANRQPHGFEADVWSCGCLLYTMLTGHPPFGTDGQVSETLNRLVTTTLDIPIEVSSEAKDLIRQLMRRDAKSRMSLQAVKMHPFLKRCQFRSQLSVASADSGRGTSFTNGSSLKPENSQRSRTSERRPPARRFGPSPPMRAIHSSDSEFRAPLPPAGPIYSIESKVSERRTPSRSCDRKSPHVCIHDQVNDDDSCAKCGNTVNRASSSSRCNHSRYASDHRCTKCGVVNNTPHLLIPHQTLSTSCEKCLSYRETGCCGGRCKTTMRGQSGNCSEEPCCSKDLFSSSTKGIDAFLSSPRSDSVVRDEHGRCLRDICFPVNAKRLKPTRQENLKYALTILEDGDVCVELYKNDKNNVNVVVEGTRISSDGMKIFIFSPKNGERMSHLSIDFDWRSFVNYTFDNLPLKFWKTYQLASKFVQLLRGKTYKIKFCTIIANGYLYENGNFEVQFFNGKKALKKKVSFDEYSSIECSDENVEFNRDEICHIDTILKKCLTLEKHLEVLEKEFECFPIVILGRSLKTAVTVDDLNKENERVSPKVHSSRTLTRRPFSDATNIAQPNKKNVFEVNQFGCIVKKLGDGNLEFEYSSGEKLLLLDKGDKLEYFSSSGKRYCFTDRNNLPQRVKEKASQINDILKLCKSNS